MAKIPQMFYLRKVWITLHVQGGPEPMRVTRPFYLFWNYRNTVNGLIDCESREVAKVAITTGVLESWDATKKKFVCNKIMKANPDADFYR